MKYNDINIKRAHFVCIGGIGMSGLAQLMKDAGVEITGSDREASPVTEMLEKKGITVLIGQKRENVTKDADIVVYSEAVWEDNPERLEAKRLEIPQASYFMMLGTVSEGKRTIAISGTHGKTTTTGMTARILKDAGASPMAIIGSIVQDFGSNYLPGESDIFVVEACEYKRDFLTLSPFILVVTNIEFDHTDYYRDLEDVQSAFRTLMEKVPVGGAIVTDATHPNIAPILDGLAARVIDYKEEPAFELVLPGEFNRMNARAAAAAARAIALTLEDAAISTSLAGFRGTWRRFDFKGETAEGALVYDDYAHHPTAVKATLAELRTRAKGKLVVAFHPHLYSRTRDLFAGFSTAFEDADQVFVAPIYAAREIDDGSVSAEKLAAAISEKGVSAEAPGSFTAIEERLREYGEGDLIVTMGAGDIYKVAEAIAAH
jgi:UDP-N-acetylmuramate--alanine ligase